MAANFSAEWKEAQWPAAPLRVKSFVPQAAVLKVYEGCAMRLALRGPWFRN
jgi:hypothetical protein